MITAVNITSKYPAQIGNEPDTTNSIAAQLATWSGITGASEMQNEDALPKIIWMQSPGSVYGLFQRL